MFSRQTAPINPPDMLGGTAPPVPGEPPPAAPAIETKRGRGRPAAVAATAPATDVQERIAAALETIAALLEVLATK
jgi:hypothetical protein